jgi:hypothetical protein
MLGGVEKISSVQGTERRAAWGGSPRHGGRRGEPVGEDLLSAGDGEAGCVGRISSAGCRDGEVGREDEDSGDAAGVADDDADRWVDLLDTGCAA